MNHKRIALPLFWSESDGELPQSAKQKEYYMRSIEIVLKEFAGQKCDVKICSRNNGSIYVMFQSDNGFGPPVLDQDKFVELNDHIKHLMGMNAGKVVMSKGNKL